MFAVMLIVAAFWYVVGALVVSAVQVIWGRLRADEGFDAEVLGEVCYPRLLLQQTFV